VPGFLLFHAGQGCGVETPLCAAMYYNANRFAMLSLLPVLMFLSQANPAAAAPPRIDLVRAKHVFDISCAGCHGPEGRGGKGPSLAVAKLRHAGTDEELGQIILFGLPGTEMPPSWYLGVEGVTLAAAYVRTLGANATPPQVAGDVGKGKQLFRGKGACAGCHTIGAEGNAFGPDLSDIGARRSAAGLRESLIHPDAEVAEGFVPVDAVTERGEKVSGIRLNEDNFTIQILDASGRFHSFRRAALSQLKEHFTESVMPSYEKIFSEAELLDLVAYLSSLRGEQ
jgi:cytochrome c oxidase cbb3-type subunit 3